jgi:hypothetical protein
MSQEAAVAETCSTKGCDREARCAVRTTRPTRADVRVTLYTDNRVAPKTACRHCQEHGLELLVGLAKVLVDGDA